MIICNCVYIPAELEGREQPAEEGSQGAVVEDSPDPGERAGTRGPALEGRAAPVRGGKDSVRVGWFASLTGGA